jgi:enoyl-CoA hydratase/carnithine racemase
MNRPEVRNALNAQAYAGLEAAFRMIQADGDIRVVVLTGADPALCSGEEAMQMMVGPQHWEFQARLAAVRPRLTTAGAANDLHECGGWVSGALGRLFLTEDHKEGVASVPEKRVPRFRGR